MTFSKMTLDLVLGLLGAGLLLWLLRGVKTSAERLIARFCLVFTSALVYSTIVSFQFTSGSAEQPTPSYSQAMLAPLMSLTFLGYSRAGRIGNAFGLLLTALFGYIIVATYFVKLMPYYAGFTNKASISSVLSVYSMHFRTFSRNLDLVSLGPIAVIFPLALTVTATTTVLAISISSRLQRPIEHRNEAMIASCTEFKPRTMP